MIGSCVAYSLLETSRISCTDRNFHVFDIIRSDAPNSLLKELGLENPPEHLVSILFYSFHTNHTYSFTFELSTILQNVLDSNSFDDGICKAFPYNFETIDMALFNIGFTEEKRKIIYKILACILYLRTITFEKEENKDDCHVSMKSRLALKCAADLIQVDEQKLERALILQVIKAGNTLIEFVFLISLLSIIYIRLKWWK